MKSQTCWLALVGGLGLSLASLASAAEVGVRIRFGLADKEAKEWDGSVAVKPGQVAAISGWRFEVTDHADGTKGWIASTRPAAAAKTNANANAKAKAKALENQSKTPEEKAKAAKDAEKAAEATPKAKKAKANQKAKAAAGAALADNGVLVTLSDVTENSIVTVTTKQGEFTFALSEIPYGKVVEKLAGAVEVERIAAARQVTANHKTDDDYPSAAAAPDGTVYVVCASFTPGIDRDERSRNWQTEPADLKQLTTPTGGDQLHVRIVKNGVAGEPIAVTGTGCDIYKSAVAVAGDGTAWIFWSQNKNYKPYPNNPTANFEIYGRSLKDGKLGAEIKISESPESDIWPVAATDSAGNVWIAWQGARQSSFKILARHQATSGWSPETAVSTQAKNCWAPAIATTKAGGGKVAIAWDSYDKGDYDVFVREFNGSGAGGDVAPVANSADYEARPAIAYDREGSLWVAWEQSGPTWGKDWGALVTRKGIGLYKDRQIGLAVLKEGKWMEPPQLLAGSLPGALARRRVNNQRVPAIEAGAEPRAAGQEAEAARNNVHNNIARLICDAAGRIWVLTRSRQNDFRSQIGSVWMTHAAYYDGNAWVGPILVPHTDNLLYNSPAVVSLPGGGLLVAHSSDHRQDRHVNQRGQNSLGILNGSDPFENDLYLSRLEMAGDAKPATLVAAKILPEASAKPSEATMKERGDLDRIRGYRAQVGGKNLQIIRGEFHRHTEISGDGGNDGPLEDMWRYAIDVAAMDWLGCGDHDNGGHREYPWWLTQKTTDAFHLPGVFEPPYTYERSVAYPEGHRNVIFTNRGIRTLPRLPKTDRDNVIHAPDTTMLYKYLKLFGGVCASHTSATGMGTDWRDNDPTVETMVEIYQGCRQNYERPGAPRSPSADDAIGGWEPKGFVNLALLKGYKFAFESSSDHTSTHISYALVYSESKTREGMLAAMKQRHTYAATDNILADFRCTAGGKEYMLGDAFTTAEPPTVKLKLAGTAPFAKVTLVKDDVEIPLQISPKAELDLTWTDPKPTAGKESYYYVRGEQEDGELVWVSPMWIKYQPK